MRRPLAALALALALVAAPGADLAAQSDGGVQLEIAVPGGATMPPEGPSIVAASLLNDAKTRELLRNGFPARLHFRVELWREAGWFDDLESMTEWDVLVQFDPTSQLYRVVRQHGRRVEDFGGFGSVSAAEAQIGRPYRVALRPRQRGRRYYYSLALDVQTLDVSDLDELQRWLRGEFQPAVHGRGSPLTAMRRGLGTLLSRVLGGDQRHYERKSGTFTVP